jgi:hypothetical protein
MSPQFIGSCHPGFSARKRPGSHFSVIPTAAPAQGDVLLPRTKTRGLPTHPGLRPPLPDFREGIKTDPKDTRYESAIHRLMSPRPLYRRKAMFFCHAKTRGLPTHPGLRPPLPDFREGLKTDPKDTKYESAIHRLMSPRPLYRRKTMFF